MKQRTIEKVSYGGWPNCYRMSNGIVELILTSDVGPRIIRYGFVGAQNMFVELARQQGSSGEPYWMPRGGHRLWISPEIQPDTYALDNRPVEARIFGDRLLLVQPVEPETQLQKEISVEFSAAGEVQVTHNIRNCGTASRLLAPWALTQMAQGGVAIVTFPPRGNHSAQLLPTNPLVMWAYTDFSDPRWLFTKSCVLLKQDPANSAPQKLGLFNEHTRAAYLLGTDLFIKRSEAGGVNRIYPDFHCSCEIFTNNDFLELETLGPLVDLPPSASTSHTEVWSLERDVHLPSLEAEDIHRTLLPLLR